MVIGRRLADDVFDVEVKGAAGAAYPLFHPDFQPDPLAAQLGDGVDENDVPFRAAFPYLALAHCNTVCQGERNIPNYMYRQVSNLPVHHVGTLRL